MTLLRRIQRIEECVAVADAPDDALALIIARLARLAEAQRDNVPSGSVTEEEVRQILSRLIGREL